VAFARVIGPFLTVVPGAAAIRAREMETLLRAFYVNPSLV
jgi:hypothetical protein